jgi:sporulation protein YlmC with PRC-barrel domain
MNRLLTYTVVGLFLGLTPALAQTEPPTDETQTPEAAQPDESPPADQPPEAPQAITPDQPPAASGTPQSLSKQDSDEWLATNLIGKSVVNANNETIGEINDLVTDQNGKVVAVVVGYGGVLGVGEKDVALRFEDLKLSRDENNDVKVTANISKETLAAAPDYQTLHEQETTKSNDREDKAQ